VIVSAGQDASVLDPLRRMTLTTEAYREFTRMMMEIAAETCGGRLVFTQEGGYAPYCTAAIVETLLGSAPGVTPIGDPYGARAESMPTTRDLGLDVVRSLDLATTVLRRYRSVCARQPFNRGILPPQAWGKGNKPTCPTHPPSSRAPIVIPSLPRNLPERSGGVVCVGRRGRRSGERFLGRLGMTVGAQADGKGTKSRLGSQVRGIMASRWSSGYLPRRGDWRNGRALTEVFVAV
jgi:hypothetical protein